MPELHLRCHPNDAVQLKHKNKLKNKRESLLPLTDPRCSASRPLYVLYG